MAYLLAAGQWIYIGKTVGGLQAPDCYGGGLPRITLEQAQLSRGAMTNHFSEHDY